MKILFKNLIWFSTLLLVQLAFAQGPKATTGGQVGLKKPEPQVAQPAALQPEVNKGGKATPDVAPKTAEGALPKKPSEQPEDGGIKAVLREIERLKGNVESVSAQIKTVREEFRSKPDAPELMTLQPDIKTVRSLSIFAMVILVVGVLLLTAVGAMLLIKTMGLSKKVVGGVNDEIEKKLKGVEELLAQKYEELEKKIALFEGLPREINVVKDKVVKQTDKFNSFDFSRLSGDMGRLSGDMGKKFNDVDAKLVSLEKKDAEIAKKDEEIGTLRKENGRLKVEQVEAMSKKRDAERLSQDVELEKKKAADAARMTMQATLDEGGKKVAAANEAVKKMQDYVHELNDKVSNLKEQLVKAEQTGYEKAYLKSSEELKKALENSERKLEELGVVKERLRLVEESVVQSAREHRSELAAKEQAHAADLAQKLAAQESKIKAEAESAKALAVQVEQRKSAVVIENLNAEVVARDGKIGDLTKTIVQKEAELASVKDACSKNADELMAMTNRRNEVQAELESLRSTLYPATLCDDPDFAPLRQTLEGWLRQKCVGAEITKAALGLFASRDALDADGWRTALFNLSVGVSSAVRASGGSPDQVVAELRRWQGFLTKFSGEQYSFQLQLPVLGSPVDASWMTAKNKGTSRVANVLSWAIFNQYGPQNNALVE